MVPMSTDSPKLEVTVALKRFICAKARQVVGKAGLTESDRADIEQDLWLDLLERWPKFQPQRARSSTFVARVVNHKVAMILRARLRAKRAPAHNGHSLDICCQDADGQTVAHAALLDEQIHGRRTGYYSYSTEELLALRADVACILSTLSARQQRLCRQLMLHPIAHIARKGNVSRTTVYHAVEQLRNKFADKDIWQFSEKVADSSPRNGVCKG